MAILYQCDLCDRPAVSEIKLEVSTVRGTPCRSLSKHLCQEHQLLVRDFEVSLIRTSEPSEAVTQWDAGRGALKDNGNG